MRYLLISIPKAGTHILTYAQKNIQHKNMPYGSMIHEQSPHKRTIEELKTLDGFGRTHIAYHPEYERIIRDRNIKALFLYRDPRDLMVSYYFWVKSQGYTGSGIPGLIDDLSPIIKSNDPFSLMIPWWGRHIRRYIPWMYVPNILSISFEDLTIKRAETSSIIGDFWTEYKGPDLITRLFSRKGPTFRKGIVGDYKNHLSEKHLQAFDQELGDVMTLWGYKQPEVDAPKEEKIF